MTFLKVTVLCFQPFHRIFGKYILHQQVAWFAENFELSSVDERKLLSYANVYSLYKESCDKRGQETLPTKAFRSVPKQALGEGVKSGLKAVDT